MQSLAIETSGRLGSVAIAQDDHIVGEDSFEHGLKHAAEMIPRIDALLKAAGWTPPDIREIYVSVGPGSFTGLRIGITLAKTLAFATGAKIVAVPTILALAQNALADARSVVIVLDAKRDQIFTARLHREQVGGVWQIVEPAHLDSLVEMLKRAPRPVWLLGEGIPYHEKFLLREDAGVKLSPPESWRALARVVAKIGRSMAEAGQFTDPQTLSPIYIRKPEAEEKFDASHGTGKTI